MTSIQRKISFPTAQPEGLVHAHVDGGAMNAEVTWSIQTVNAGPTRSSASYERHLQDTVGSSFDWSDEVRFDRRTGRLASFVLKVPEAGTLGDEIAASWLALPALAGIPDLDDREQGFHIDPLDLRYFAADGSALLAMGGHAPTADAESLRLAIGGDVDLLFHAGRYCGWVLREPVARLVAKPGDPVTGMGDPRLAALLHEYLLLVVEPIIERMSDEDPAVLGVLQALRARASELDGIQAGALRGAIDQVLETFYPS